MPSRNRAKYVAYLVTCRAQASLTDLKPKKAYISCAGEAWGHIELGRGVPGSNSGLRFGLVGHVLVGGHVYRLFRARTVCDQMGPGYMGRHDAPFWHGTGTTRHDSNCGRADTRPVMGRAWAWVQTHQTARARPV